MLLTPIISKIKAWGIFQTTTQDTLHSYLQNAPAENARLMRLFVLIEHLDFRGGFVDEYSEDEIYSAYNGMFQGVSPELIAIQAEEIMNEIEAFSKELLINKGVDYALSKCNPFEDALLKTYTDDSSKISTRIIRKKRLEQLFQTLVTP